MSEASFRPIFPKTATASTIDGDSLNFSLSEDAKSSYTLTFPASNTVGYLLNDGTGRMSWQSIISGGDSEINLADGLYNDPSLRFISETNTGLFKKSVGEIGISCLGTELFSLSSNLLSINSPFNINVATKSGAIATDGISFNIKPLSFTDNTTVSSGMVNNIYFNKIGIPTLLASNTNVTTTNAATFYIEGSPIQSTNETITNKYSLLVGGDSKFKNNLTIDGNVIIGGTLTVDSVSITGSGGTGSFSGTFTEIDLTGQNSYNLTTTNEIISFMDSDITTKQVFLPLITNGVLGKIYIILKSSTNIIEVTRSGSDLVDNGLLIQLIDQYDRIKLFASSNNRWHSI